MPPSLGSKKGKKEQKEQKKSFERAFLLFLPLFCFPSTIGGRGLSYSNLCF
jgi:hypothetical protein